MSDERNSSPASSYETEVAGIIENDTSRVRYHQTHDAEHRQRRNENSRVRYQIRQQNDATYLPRRNDSDRLRYQRQQANDTEFRQRRNDSDRLRYQRQQANDADFRQRRNERDRQRYQRRQETLPITLEWNRPCPYNCGYIHLNTSNRSAMARCCKNGTLLTDDFPQKIVLQAIEEPLLSIYRDTQRMSISCNTINNILAFAATGVENDIGGGYMHDMLGPHAVKLNGRTYHILKEASSSTDPSCGLSYFVFDNVSTLTVAAQQRSVNEEIVKNIFNYLLVHNPIARCCRAIGTSIIANSDRVLDQQTSRLVANLNNNATYLEVAAITNANASGNKIVRFQLKNKPHASTIDMTSEMLEPLCYPLLFTKGEDGWGEKYRAHMSFPEYMAWRMLKPENIWLPSAHDATNLIQVNRFQMWPRLGQTWLVDMVSRAIDYRLRWNANNQDNIFCGSKQLRYNNELHVSEVVNDDEKTTFLPSSFHGSPRHLRQLSQNALSIVSEYGPPDVFITLTCNPTWKEITSKLLPGQTAFDRPDIVAPVFKAKLDIFLQNLKDGKYFGERNVVYLVRVIEYQHRGMPHAHIVVKFSNMPDMDDIQGKIDFINIYISAKAPTINANSSPDDRRYYEYVHRHMVHHCAVATNGCKKSATSTCRRGYDKTKIGPTCFDEKGFPIYERTSESDFKIVPHNRKILLDWDGHCNVEYSGGVRCVLYLYKYLFKGSKKASFNLSNDTDDSYSACDEVSIYLKGRFLCSMDAMWRVLGYHTYPAPTPSVQTIKVKLPEQVAFLLNDAKSCDLLVYFNRPLELQNLKYIELYKNYVCKSKLPVMYSNASDLYFNNINGYFEINIRGLKLLYLCKRQSRENNSIVRMEMVPLSSGELWYLRLLLLHRCPISFDDTRTINGVRHNTFQMAAVAANLVTDLTVAIECFQQSIGFAVPSALRGLFATLTVQGYPTLPIYQDPALKHQLLQDWLEFENSPLNMAQAENKFLIELQLRLKREDKTLEMYGFPKPLDQETELERELLLYPVRDQQILYERLDTQFPNNQDQQNIFDKIMDAVQNPSEQKRFFFIDGPGGTGKTTIVKKLIAAIRALGCIVKVCASTSLAATNYDDATTAHALFNYPVVNEEDKDMEIPTECNLFNSERFVLLQNTVIIFWDEFVSNHRELFEAVLRALTGMKIIFVSIGDFRQILPVIENGKPQDTINACITSSPVWPRFQRLRLTVNIRLILTEHNNLSSMSNMLLAIGEGRSHESAIIISEDVHNHTSQVGLPHMEYFEDSESNSALTWLYNNVSPYHNDNRNSAILTATNEKVDEWNQAVQEMNQRAGCDLFSHDSFADVDDPNGYLSRCLTEPILNTFNANGVPTHKLHLKVNDICLITRAIKSIDIATNTRVQILHISDRIIRVQVLGDPQRPPVLIPKIRFKFTLKYGQSYKMMRCQFPLRLAYCFTYNRAQGQTLHKVLLDATFPPFEHGHLYVAMSRNRAPQNIRIYLTPSQLHNNPYDNKKFMPTITNVVYPSIITKCLHT